MREARRCEESLRVKRKEPSQKMKFSLQNYGYLIVVSGFFIFGGLLSPISSYGRLFTNIQNDMNTTALQTGWIGSIAWATNFLVSPFAVFIESRVGYCATTVLGSVMTSAAYLISSFMGSYEWVLLFLGFICGSSAGLCIHSSFCVLYKYFLPAHQTIASSLMSTGASVATILVSISYEKMVPTFGWRTTLQATSIFAAVLAILPSFFISPDRHIGGHQKEIQHAARTDRQRPYKTTKTDEVQTIKPCNVENNQQRSTWLKLCFSWRAWLILFSLLFPAMCWSVYWVNIISYFESISIPEDDILLFVTVMTVTDLLGRIFLVVVIHKLPFGETGLLCISNSILFVLTILFVLCPSKPVLLICSVFIGVGRGWYNVLPYRVSVDLLEADDSDQGITLAMVALGVGFSVGTLPAGATYDATGSYTYAFLLNAVLYLLGALILLILQMERRIRGEKKRRHRGPTVVYSIECAMEAIQKDRQTNIYTDKEAGIDTNK